MFVTLFALLMFRISFDSASKNFSAKNDSWIANGVCQLDVGQGDSALIRFLESNSDQHERFGLVDVGSARTMTELKWIEQMMHRNIKHLDFVLLTQMDEDHAGGLMALASAFSIGCVGLDPVWSDDPRVSKLRKDLAGFDVPLLSPEECVRFPIARISGKKSKRGKLKTNTRMLAVRIPLKNYDYLNLGDATGEDESILLDTLSKAAPNPQKELILKASHHGSRTSSSGAFIQRITRVHNIKEVWVSSGKYNRYGHPHHEVIARYLASNVTIKRTDQLGMLCTPGL